MTTVKRSVNVAVMLRRAESFGTQLRYDYLGVVEQREMALRQVVDGETFGVLVAGNHG